MLSVIIFVRLCCSVCTFKKKILAVYIKHFENLKISCSVGNIPNLIIEQGCILMYFCL